MTLNGAMAVIMRYYTKLVKARPILTATEMYSKEYSFWQCMIYGDRPIRRVYREHDVPLCQRR